MAKITRQNNPAVQQEAKQQEEARKIVQGLLDRGFAPVDALNIVSKAHGMAWEYRIGHARAKDRALGRELYG